MDRIRLVNVGKQFSRRAGAKILANWGFWRGASTGTNWFWALDRVNLSVPEAGKRIGIVGSNGSGKTTLLRIIAGVTRPTEGSATIRGRVVPLLELFAGMHPDLTGRENIFLNGIILGMRRREVQKKFEEIVEFSGIGPSLDMPLKHYSYGMQMRLGFSVAAHIDADIILVDEALGIGDAEFQVKILQKLNRMHQQGAVVILVSHDLDIIRKLTDQTLWLHEGRAAAFGPSAEVIDAYLKAVQSDSKPLATSAQSRGRYPS